ncbi:hypothetical protein PSEUBRA_005592 [Kalmanozyma brasiliensis GHG001]|uniref:uncharacterized protein n=1 Tax=Kalmanozyma brasiliensis (strain GHG001) TaxID=1365824 RepID=UPI002867EF1E|nr:uncharacterized protein PSEUBRA_005592 [Kalmanozyma brasiliensis GHG001]KAF6767532.1 hypothetical protein PSEUBRA_005592 [Kalmanozyma brasiliensis GHG001]
MTLCTVPTQVALSTLRSLKTLASNWAAPTTPSLRGPSTTSKRTFVSSIERLPDATPLALDTIKQRLDNIIRHKKFPNVKLNEHVCRDVMRIIRDMARQLNMYPTGVLNKWSITEETVAALRAGVWIVAAPDVHQFGARSIQSLLSLHTMIMFMHEFGGQVTSWLDRCDRSVGEVGRFLRCSMVAVEFCGNSNSGDPQFVINVNSNMSKKAGLFDDLSFHVNAMATRQDQPKSQDAIFSLLAFGLAQDVLLEELRSVCKDREFGESLLISSKGLYVFTADDDYADCPVFIYGRTPARQPEVDIRANRRKDLFHASDEPA